MQITLCGVRGSIPTPLSSEEVLQRIISQSDGEQISVRKLKSLAKSGRLSYGGDTSCVVVEDQDTAIIIDAGTGIRRVNNMDVGQAKEIHLLLTHLHWDHIQGLPFFKAMYTPGCKVHIHSVVDIKTIKKAFKQQWTEPFFPVPYAAVAPQLEFHQLDMKDKIGSLKIEAIKLAHPFPTYGYKVSSKTSSYAHFSDTEISLLKASEKTKYKNFLKNVDFVVADSQFDPQEVIEYKTWGHSCVHQFIDILAGGKPKTLGLFHYNPMESEEKIDDIFKKAKAYQKKVEGGSAIKLITCIEGQTHQI